MRSLIALMVCCTAIAWDGTGSDQMHVLSADETVPSCRADVGMLGVLVGVYHGALTPLGAWGRQRGWQAFDSNMDAVSPEWTSPCTLSKLGFPPVTVAWEDLMSAKQSLSGPWLVTCGDAAFDSPSARVLPNELDIRAHWIRETLKMTGEWFSYWPDHPDCEIRQNVEVDLNGDGRPERLLVVSGGITYDIDLVAVGFVDADGAVTEVEVLTEDAWIEYRLRHLRAAIISAADLNGDGYCEVALRINIPDGFIYEIHSLGRDGLQLALRRVSCEH